MNALQDKVVVITGGSRGLGHATALEFSRSGAYVAICSRIPDGVQRALAGLPDPTRVLGVPCDVRDLDQVRQLADATEKKFGRIDIWINNAGVSHPYHKMMDVDSARWRESFDTNFWGTYHGVRAALEKMLPRKNGRVISILGFGADRPAPNQSGYGTSKTAVWRLTQTLAQEYAGSGVEIFAAQPGMIWTEMLTQAEGVDVSVQSRFEWAMRVFGNAPTVPAQWVARIAAQPNVNGKMLRLVTPKMFVPRMIGEMLGAGKRNPRPWENLAG
jgi:glucose 1-dehydrogenase